MKNVSMTLDGVDKLKAAVARQPELVRRHMTGVIQATSFSVAQRAKALAPVDTGALKSSITAQSRGLSGSVRVQGGVIHGRRPEIYWRFIEYGTVKTPARPLFRAATEAETSAFETRIRNIVPAIERDFASGRLL